MAMRVEFRQGVPRGCTQWLRENVGLGNIEEDSDGSRTQQWMIDIPEYAWFYERVKKVGDPVGKSSEIYYVPTITVKDPKLASWFIMRWT
jgi:hypothetical protein